ncbi:MAG: sigma-54 dependent transcriptional regulator [Kofleriaceae bacterium]
MFGPLVLLRALQGLFVESLPSAMRYARWKGRAWGTKLPHILIVDDEPSIRRRMEQVLQHNQHTTETASSGEEALEAVRARRPDLVLMDVQMGGMDGLEALPLLRREAPRTPVVIMTGADSVEICARAFRLGAADFVTKPFDISRLEATVAALLAPTAAPAMIGGSPRFCEAMDLVRQFGPPDINVLLHGETGTGKELFARAIHANSKRRAGPFVAVDCSILSESLIESELFGHEKGSFTGATGSRIGHFERADGGTLFLDEIGNLSLAFQAKLLRVLQERTIERVGGRETIKLDLRVISATNVDLRERAQHGAFRSDLFYRLAEVTIAPPPLREREGDVALIAAHFVERYAARFGSPVRGISAAALERLSTYPWPGNVRELESAIKSAVVRASDVVLPEHFSAEIGEGTPTPASTRVSMTSTPSDARSTRISVEIEFDDEADQLDLKALAESASDQAERAVLAAVLSKGKYTHAQLAKKLNVDPKTLRAKLRKYGLDSE